MANSIAIEKTESGLEVLKREKSTVKGKSVSLTRKTNKAGEIRHGVVLTNNSTGTHRRVATFTEITPAFKLYKSLVEK